MNARRPPLSSLLFLLGLLVSPASAQASNALSLDGSAAYVDLGELDPGANFTFEAWVRFDSVVLSQAVVSASQLSDNLNALYVGSVQDSWVVELDDDDIYENDDCEFANTLCVPEVLAEGVPMHVALVVQGTTMTLYVDGVELGSEVADSPPVFGLDTWILGAETDGVGGGFGSDALTGFMDEVRLWSVARSQADILCTIDYALTGSEGGLFARWAMDESVFSSLAPDSTGNGWDGLLWGDASFAVSPFTLIESTGGDIPCFDGDSDGFSVADGDCDDGDAGTYPGAAEVPYDGADNDCSGDGDLTDVDGDGFDAAAVGGEDCDDTAANVHPDAVEIPYNGVDEDCDPSTPDDDLDGDGFGVTDDCDDLDADRYPGATEIPDDGIDQDCNGFDEVTGDDDDATADDDDATADDDDTGADDDDTGADDDDFGFGDDDDSSVLPVRRSSCECGPGDATTASLLPLLLLGGLGAPLRRRRRPRA